MSCSSLRVDIFVNPSVRSLYFSGLISLKEDISWSKDSPYTDIKTRDEYLKPFFHFDHDTAKIIRKAQSLESSLYWIRREFENNGRCGSLEIYIQLFGTVLQWITRTVMYGILIILGTCTLGLLLPRGFREKLLALGSYNKEDNGEEKGKANL